MTNNIDGIIYFNHDENWAKKKVDSYLKKNMSSFKGIKSFSDVTIEKKFLPYYEYTVSGNIHSFVSFTGEGTTDYYEVEVDATRKFLSNDTNDLKQNLIKGIMPYKTEKLEKYDKDKVNGALIEFGNNETNNKINEIRDNIVEPSYKKISDYFYWIGEEEIRKAFETVAINSCYTSYSLGMKKECDSLIDYSIIDASKYYFPLWIVKIKDGEEIYEYYINDQTGMITGELKEVKKSLGIRTILLIGFLIAILPILTSLIILLDVDKTALYALVVAYLIIGLCVLISKVYSGFKSEYEYGKSRLVEKKVKYKKRFTFESSFEKARDNYFKVEEK